MTDMLYRGHAVPRKEIRPSASFIERELPLAYNKDLAFSLAINENGTANPPLTYDEFETLRDIYSLGIPCEVERKTVPIYSAQLVPDKNPKNQNAGYEVARRSRQGGGAAAAFPHGYEDYLPRKKIVKTTLRTKVRSFTGRSTIDIVRVKSRCLPPKCQYHSPPSSSCSPSPPRSSSPSPSPSPSPSSPSRSNIRRVEISPEGPSGAKSPPPANGPKTPPPSPPVARIQYNPPIDPSKNNTGTRPPSPPPRSPARISYHPPIDHYYPEMKPTTPPPMPTLAPSSRASTSPARSSSRSPSRVPTKTISRPSARNYTKIVPGTSSSRSPVRAAPQSAPLAQDLPRPRSRSPAAVAKSTTPRSLSPAPVKSSSSRRSISPSVKVPAKKVTFADPLMANGKVYERTPINSVQRRSSPHPKINRAATVEDASDEE